jgi:oligopeptidase B
LDDCERAYQVKRHRIGQDVSKDQVLYHEEDEMFFVTIYKSCNGKYIFVKLAAQITSETRYISADDPYDIPHLLVPRRENIQYSCEHHGGYFYILSNEGAKNNYIFRTPVPPPSDQEHSADFVQENQQVVIEHRDFVLIMLDFLNRFIPFGLVRFERMKLILLMLLNSIQTFLDLLIRRL